MSPAGPPSFDEIKAALVEIERLLRQAFADDPHAPEAWRVRVAAEGIAPVLAMLDREDLPAAEKYRQVAGGLRGVFRGWADSSEEFTIPVEPHRRMQALYERTVAVSGHP
jgi:hypothetical protein